MGLTVYNFVAAGAQYMDPRVEKVSMLLMPFSKEWTVSCILLAAYACQRQVCLTPGSIYQCRPGQEHASHKSRFQVQWKHAHPQVVFAHAKVYTKGHGYDDDDDDDVKFTYAQNPCIYQASRHMPAHPLSLLLLVDWYGVMDNEQMQCNAMTAAGNWLHWCVHSCQCLVHLLCRAPERDLVQRQGKLLTVAACAKKSLRL